MHRQSTVCQTCGVTFGVFPSRLKVGRSHFCSRACAIAARLGPSVIVVCKGCGISFRVTQGEMRNRTRTYCTRGCYRAQRPPTVRLCQYCGGPLTVSPAQIKLGGGKFCTRACFTAFNRRPDILGRRFWSRVDKNGPVPEHRPELGSCWVWTGKRNPSGYGYVSTSARLEGTHRLAWMLTRGALPAGLFACHHCDNPSCVRPEHLFLGTHRENMRDMRVKGRAVSGNRK